MATKTAKKKTEPEIEIDANTPRPRLRKLAVRNFRAIGNEQVVIELDEIVVLVGPNNAGKSSILRAYEVVMNHGSNNGKLSIEDFPNSQVTADRLPEIELETVVFDEMLPGERWVAKDADSGEMVVRERWTFTSPNAAPQKVGWDVANGQWHEKEGPWGAPGVAQAGRPEPHRIEAFANPEKQADQIVSLLKEALTERIDALRKPGEDGELPKGKLQQLQKELISLQKEVAAEAKVQIASVEDRIGAIVGAVFPGHSVVFDAKLDEEPKITWFNTPPSLRMGPTGGYQPSIEQQGSGARRTLLWAALRILSEQNREKQAKAKDRPHLLLMDEPELCLHPNAIREACKVLYDLPKSGNWQVMVTTHSPIFIDLSRDNTSIVRVERTADGNVHGTTIYRPQRASLDEDDRTRLKLLNAFDPYVAEFFFGGRVVVCEGDTEFTAFAHVVANSPERFKDIHIIRARGKATISTICKILNQFGSAYAVLHDSDKPTVIGRKTKKERGNPAWTVNKLIRASVEAGLNKGRVRLVASVPNFEEAYFGEEAEDEKPYSALEVMKKDGDMHKRIEALLEALIDPAKTLPDGAIAWKGFDELEKAFTSWNVNQNKN